MSRTTRVAAARISAPLPVALLTLSACVSYEPAPLDGSALVERVDAERHATATSESVTLSAAADWLRACGPSVRESLARWRTAQAVADTPTPFPNPTVAAGPLVGWGDDVIGSPATTWFASLGVNVPIGGRLGAQDAVNAARAEAQRLRAELELKQRYLELRRLFAAFVLTRARATILEETATIARTAATIGRQLAEAGRVGALDVALLELEAARRATDRLQADLMTVDRQAALASLCGVAAERFEAIAEESLPDPGATIPAFEELKASLAAHSEALVSLRADYEIAEAQLRLEVTRQYPDLSLQMPFTDEPGEDRSMLWLSVGFTVPAFDRNQPAIAEATLRRDELRERYMAAARRSLAELERAHRAADIAHRRREMLATTVGPQARQNIELVQQTLAAGQGDALQMLEVQRSAREIELELLDARTEELRAWADLEAVIGHPLLDFPGERDEPPLFENQSDAEETP